MTKVVDFLTEEQVTRAMLLGVVICWDDTQDGGQPQWFVYNDVGFLNSSPYEPHHGYFYTPEEALNNLIINGNVKDNWSPVINSTVGWETYPPPGGVRKSGK